MINGHVRDTINGIDFVNSENGIAVADVGFIIHTSDGGENWQLCDNITENNLTSIQFITDQIAYAVGWYGTIMKTVNGGETWEMLSGTTANDLEQVTFATGDVNAFQEIVEASVNATSALKAAAVNLAKP